MFNRLSNNLDIRFLQNEVLLFERWRVAVTTLWILILAGLVNILEAAGGPYIYYPDSANYIDMAYLIFYQESFQNIGTFRVPGYPLFIAPFLGLFGKQAMIAIVIAQHTLAAGISVLVLKIGNELDRSRLLGLIAGIFSSFSLNLHSFARAPMTEVLYVFLATSALLFAMRYLRTGRLKPFAMAALLFSVATMVRPAGKLLPIILMTMPLAKMMFPRWRFLMVEGAVSTWREQMKFIAVAAIISSAVVTPWMFRNLFVHDYFGLSPALGINLYSVVVDVGKFEDPNSPALADIKQRWDEYEATRIARGLPPETKYTWRDHAPAYGYYLAATGKPQQEVDKVFTQAAIDGIKAHPVAYFRHVVRGVFMSLTLSAGAYRFVPGVTDQKYPPAYMPYALPAETFSAQARETLARVSSRYIPEADNPFRWRSPTALSPVFGALSSAYFYLQQQRIAMLLVLFIGVAIGVIRMVKDGTVVWLGLFVYLGYTTVVPILVAQVLARIHIPAEPVMDVFYGIAIISAFSLAVRLLKKVFMLSDH